MRMMSKPLRPIALIVLLAILGAVTLLRSPIRVAPGVGSVRWDGLFVEAIAKTGWKGKSRRTLRAEFIDNRREFEGFVSSKDTAKESFLGLKVHYGKGYIDFRDGLCGLRYYENVSPRFSENAMFIRIDRLTSNWYVYEIDWN